MIFEYKFDNKNDRDIKQLLKTIAKVVDSGNEIVFMNSSTYSLSCKRNGGYIKKDSGHFSFSMPKYSKYKGCTLEFNYRDIGGICFFDKKINVELAKIFNMLVSESLGINTLEKLEARG